MAVCSGGAWCWISNQDWDLSSDDEGPISVGAPELQSESCRSTCCWVILAPAHPVDTGASCSACVPPWSLCPWHSYISTPSPDYSNAKLFTAQCTDYRKVPPCNSVVNCCCCCFFFFSFFFSFWCFFFPPVCGLKGVLAVGAVCFSSPPFMRCWLSGCLRWLTFLFSINTRTRFWLIKSYIRLPLGLWGD